MPHARGLALPAQIPVPSCAEGSLRLCFPTRVLPAHPASWARSPGTSSQLLGALGESGCCSHPHRRLRRGGDSPAPVAESGQQLPAGGDRSPPGTFETQIGHGRYLKMPASSCRWLGWAGGGCWGPRRVWGAGLVVGGSPWPGPQPGPPQHPGAARNPRPWVHGAAGGNPGCPQTLRVPVSHDSPQPPSPQGTSWAASGYESFIRAGAHLRTLIAATQAWPWLGSWLPRKSVPERART